MNKLFFDLLLIVPLEEEFEVVVDSFDITEDLSAAENMAFAAKIVPTGLTVLIVQQLGMGKTNAIQATQSAMDRYDFGAICCLGIAGSISDDAKIGDICVSTKIFDVVDNAKVQSSEGSGSKISLSPTVYTTPIALLTAFSRDKLSPETKPLFETWSSDRGAFGTRLMPNDFRGRKKRRERVCNPKVIQGPIATGHVSSDEEYNRSLSALDRKMLAIETEAGGVFWVANQRQIDAICIRGVSDYAGNDKNEFEIATENKARKYAVGNAATFLAATLGRSKLANYFQAIRDHREEGQPTLELVKSGKDAVCDVIALQADSIDARLKALSPSYALQEKGYRLPVPRIRLSEYYAGLGERKFSEPIELRDTLFPKRSIIVELPREYPDLSLAWVLANDLLTAQIGDKQIVPIVVEAKYIQLPKNGLLHASTSDLSCAIDNEEVVVVFIIDNFEFSSKTKSEFLAQELARFPQAAFVILNKSRAHASLEADFLQKTSSDTARICDVSFAEISFFLQKNFEMDSASSQVVATRLRETFSSFRLPAHPTFFAGIPRDTLTALLQANRRVELIELAVAGYLSFIVAGDDSPVQLSRTTREEFLTQVAVKITIEKKNFTHSELVSFAEGVAKQKDFDVSPINFVSAFFEKGIFHDEDENVVFTLPFLQSFLLAKFLHNNSQVALDYFALGSSSFDHSVFSLYAEMGAESTLVDGLESALLEAISQLKKREKDQPIHLGTRLQPALLEHIERAKFLEKRLQEAAEDVRSGKNDVVKKQKLLDATDRVRETAVRKQNAGTSVEAKSRAKDQTTEDIAIANWYTAVSLLGAGAERLDATTKRSFIVKITELAGLLIHCATTDAHSTDFSQLRADLKSDEEFLKEFDSEGKKGRLETAKKALDGVVDLIEFLSLSMPFYKIIEVLCEEARDIVLSTSIINADVQGNMNNLIRAIWLADVEPSKGKEHLAKALKKLPDAKFLRFCIATHLMTRVYWKHWNPSNRLLLLGAATESIKGTGRTFKVEEIKRSIGRERSD
jgi:nucleoside phosphorylase